ncbi:hypothetical protein NIES4071_70950 [Calothrix sp. NIES-4071]|nr:hypothetical protein NIES4071_70950 [Calothrix sp. NIES-4071]BAZ61370.1 hypothetical protein NIES4105_70900 [Calothrix sp. NIES-4105]
MVNIHQIYKATKHVLDFIEFLASKYAQPQETPQQRILGLNKAEFWILDDFNDPLPDEFWLGNGTI